MLYLKFFHTGACIFLPMAISRPLSLPPLLHGISSVLSLLHPHLRDVLLLLIQLPSFDGRGQFLPTRFWWQPSPMHHPTHSGVSIFLGAPSIARCRFLRALKKKKKMSVFLLNFSWQTFGRMCMQGANPVSSKASVWVGTWFLFWINEMGTGKEWSGKGA